MDFEWIEDLLTADTAHQRNFNPRVDGFETYFDDEFKRRYRLKKETAYNLLSFLMDELTPATQRNQSITASLQVLITLRLLAGKSYQTVCGDLSSVSQASVSRIFKRVIEAICKLRTGIVRFPEELEPIKRAFFNVCGFPGVIGCIDGTHVPILQPSDHPQPEIFRCRKGFFSINSQIVCGPDHTIYNIVARWPGSTHDSRIFNNSTLISRLEGNELNGFLLGDGGYACKR